MRVVLDTNCVISALLFTKGPMLKLKNLWKSRAFIPVICNQTVMELVRVLSYPKFSLKKSEIEFLLEEYLLFSESYQLNDPIKEVRELEDPHDAIFINLGQRARTDYLVSGDRHILGICDYYPELHIITPSIFINKFK